MDVRRQFPAVHWIWGGGISSVYEVHPLIVVKVPKPGEFEREQFQRELKIYEAFSQHPPCPSVVQCFHYTNNGIFLEYMRDVCLSYRIQCNHVRDQQTMVVTKVAKLEPLSLRKEWMNDLAQAVAFLESLNLAHGDLRPENILLDCDRLKLSDFDCTAEIGTYFEACIPPYGRVLNSNETDQGSSGSAGFLGPRTEQFALGSLYYLINYGFEVYGDRCLTEDPKEHGRKTVDLLQNMEFPKLDGDPPIDNIINKCWHNKYSTVAELAADTQMLLRGEIKGEVIAETIAITPWRTDIGSIIRGLWCSLGDWLPFSRRSTKDDENNTEDIDGRDRNDDSNCNVDEDHLAEDLASKKAFCQDLEKRGLLHLLSSGEPEQLGFTFDWYRYTSSAAKEQAQILSRGSA
ncbi:protein kinase [Histoplasma capsulatum var. duboisii H88]|uniref:Protein kinase n=3 Tax=Ajellomyces capsulatus TaxID=5037 RepID=F0U9V6_AJEC8|nr:protein kinase [Histoplasma capsulatum H143]EGC42778.1 protein kinase [Histoplasma capsulatum var. duboisii H88]